MSEESGQFDVRKMRSGGIWLPLSILAAVVTFAVAWGSNVNRVAQLESQQTKDEAIRQRMEEHIENDDKQLAVLSDHMVTIIEELRDLNAKMDRAQEDRDGRH